MKKWTRDDEQRLSELLERKARFNEKYRLVLADAVNDTCLVITDGLLDSLIENADKLRDALEPYDSGVRAAVMDRSEV